VLFLSDILSTGYQATVNAGVERSSTIAIFGAGPGRADDRGACSRSRRDLVIAAVVDYISPSGNTRACRYRVA